MKALCFGSMNIDYVYSVDHFVEPGETLHSDNFEIICGGKGLNQVIAAAKAGADAYIAGAVSESGLFLKNHCAANGVDVSLVKESTVNTGHAIIQVDKNGQNCILLYGGANRDIMQSDVDHALAGFSKGDYLILQNEINNIGYIMEKARETGMTIVFNPSPADGELLKYPLHLVDIFVLNEIEGEQLTGESDEKKIIRAMSEKYPSAKVVLTLGRRGSVMMAGEELISQGAFATQAVDSTGAGDTFTGYFVAEMMRGASYGDALKLSSKAASIAVSVKGASDSIPLRADVERADMKELT